jgi:glycosyltransferase involved in cell wall biosynthesis
MSEILENHGEIHESLVSVGIPTYNNPNGLRRTLTCITGQTHKNLEIIVSDNCSPGPETEAVVQEFIAKDSRVRYYRQEKNNGVFSNFQFVLETATADYFMWAADDDLWDTNFVSSCLSCLIKNPEYGVVFSKFWVISISHPYAKMKNFPDMSFLSHDDSYMRIKGYILISEPSHKANLFYGLWRKEMAKKLLQFYCLIGDSNILYGVDIVMIIGMLAQTKAYQLNDVLYYKCYNGYPPGHFFNNIDYILPAKKRAKHTHVKGSASHISLIKKVLEAQNVWDERYEQVLSGYLKQHDYRKLKVKIRSIYNMLKAGII